MNFYTRPSDYVLFVKKYRKLINEHSNDNLTKEQIEHFKLKLAFQQAYQTSLLAVKNEHITILTIDNPTGDFTKDIRKARDFVKKNHREIVDENGKVYSWFEFSKLF